ncbi:RDD family protein [Solirubrobacter soli]|uniref:RDD family protein n=1 Tax=Solirubrobacter soli TaxID=363832 RepID=UPI0003F880E6|nr:RDD family protein [Solirubrobacter soli]
MSYEQAPQAPPGSYSSGPSGPRAGFWQRFGAAFLDGLILLVPTVILRVIFKDSVGLYYLFQTIISLGYYTYFEGGPTGQTIGKRALGIRVYDFREGGAIGYGRGFLRQIGKYIAAIPLFLGYFWMLWDKEKQCWQDKIAGTVVVPADAYR